VIIWKDDRWMMSLKGCRRKLSWLNLRYYRSICLEGLRKSLKSSVRTVSGRRYETSTSWIRTTSVSHSTTTFGETEKIEQITPCFLERLFCLLADISRYLHFITLNSNSVVLPTIRISRHLQYWKLYHEYRYIELTRLMVWTPLQCTEVQSITE
jgi:hypothetical protein